MATIAEIRQKFPQYGDMTDSQLADAMYKAHYSDMPREKFDSSIGMSAPVKQATPAGGGLESFIRSAANGATFNLADTIAAAGDATIPLDSGSSKADSWLKRFEENRAHQREMTAADQANNPGSSLAGGVAGGFLNPVTRALPIPKTAMGAIGSGAGVGAAYGAGGGISNQKDTSGILGDSLAGGLTGGALGGALHGAAGLVRGATRNPDAVLLNQNNIPTTIGQDLGGGFKRAEDAATSMPYGGDAIIARQKEGLGGFNRAVENNTLDPLNMKLLPKIATGNDAGKVLKTINDAAYKAAYTGATIQKTPGLVADLQATTDHFPAGLDSASVQKDLNNRVLNAFDSNGMMSSKAFNDAKDWLAEHARTTQSMSNDQLDIANAYKKALTALKGELSAQDAQRAAMLKAADKMYARRMPLVDAAGNTNASMKGGIVTPAQLSSAMDRADQSAHGLQYSLGTLPMQNMVQAAQRTLPSSVPDSGTAIRRILSGGVPAAAAASAGGLAVGLPGVAAAGLPLLATRLLYSKAGQKAAKAALFGAPQTRAKAAAAVPILPPGLLALIGSGATQTEP